MLRPATPLSVLFFVALVMLLLSSISTPLVKGITLASHGGTDFGVWGFCKGDDCSQVEIGYKLDDIGPTRGDYTLDETRRHSVSYILIAHPIAAFLSLICFSLAVASHFHSPAHSPRFLLALLLLTIPTMLMSMLAFLVDVLLFIPHIQWGGWLVLAASIILVACTLVTCGMRRTLVSRKARRKRIQENAEMSGENYFARTAVQEATLPRAESPPPLSGSVSPHTEKVMGYSSLDLKPPSRMGDRTPVNAASTLSFRTAPSINSDRNGYGNGGPGFGLRQPQRDQYGVPIPQGDGYEGPNGALLPPLRPKGSDRSMGSYGSDRSMGQRGGFGPARGGFPPRGGPMMRGGPGMRGPPPPGWSGGRGRGGMGPGMRSGRRGGSPEYDGGRSYTPDARNQSPGPFNGPPRSNSPSPPLPMLMQNGVAGEKMRDLDGRAVSPQSNLDRRGPNDMPLSDQVYVPPRAQWNTKPTTPVLRNRALSPIQASPTEHNAPPPETLDSYIEDVDPRFAEPSPPQNHAHPVTSSSPQSVPSSNSLPASLVATYQIPVNSSRTPPPPSNLVPAPLDTNQHGLLRPPPLEYDRYGSYDSLPLAEGQRSPNGSEASHFTSISQRGVNPNWRPPPGSSGPGSRPPKGPSHEDMILNGNPDFSIPAPNRGHRGRPRGRGGRGGGPGNNGLMPGIGGGPYPSASNASAVGSRYPTP